MDSTTLNRAHRRRESQRGTQGALDATSPSVASAPSYPASTTSTDDGTKSEARSEPRSEYLRKALQDRKDARAARPKPAEEAKIPADPAEPPPEQLAGRGSMRTPSPVRNLPSPEPSLVGDEWTSDVLEGDRPSRPRGGPAATGIASRNPRRSSVAGGRPSEPGFNGTPSKDAQAKMDRLSNENFNLKHRLTLQQEQVKELVSKLEKALTEIQELKKSEAAKDAENKLLEADLQDLERILEDRDAEIDQLNAEKTELFTLQEEMAKEMEMRDEAIDEATDMIMQSEEECARVKAELEALQREHAAATMAATAPAKEADSDYYSTEAERESPKRKARPKESTDSKLSTSHSDYYSGRSSPHDHLHHEPVPSLPPHLIPSNCVPERKLGPLSERAQVIVQQKSISSARLQEVRKRLSYASEATESVVDPSEDQDRNPNPRSFGRRLQTHHLPLIKQEATEFEPPLRSPTLASPHRRQNQSFRARQAPHGLRGLYQNGELVGADLPPRSATTAPTQYADPAPYGSVDDAGSFTSGGVAIRSSQGSLQSRGSIGRQSSNSDREHRYSPLSQVGRPSGQNLPSRPTTRDENTTTRLTSTSAGTSTSTSTPTSLGAFPAPPPIQHSRYPPPPLPPPPPPAYPSRPQSAAYGTRPTASSVMVHPNAALPINPAGGSRDFFFNPGADFEVTGSSGSLSSGSVDAPAQHAEGQIRVAPARTRKRYRNVQV